VVPGEKIPGMGELRWYQRWAEAIVTGLVAAALAAGGTYLYEKHPTLLAPFTYGLVCVMAGIVSCAASFALKRIPKPQPKPNLENIEKYVRDWLDRYGLTVRNDPADGIAFRYRVVLPAPDSENLTIFRMKVEEAQYIQVYADLSVTEEQGKHLLADFTRKQLGDALFDLKLELARVRIGYSGLTIPPLDFKVFRKVYIHAELRETEFYSAIHEVEAAIHLVNVVYLRLLENSKHPGEDSTPPVSVSDIPTLALPPASS
jgi:hypothetical protein